MKSYVYFQTTDNCNLKCSHCFQSAGPDKKDTTISEEDFKRVINNLLNKKSVIILTGGEVFSIKDEFYSFMRIISKENKFRKKKDLRSIDLIVQTNGLWAKDDESTKSIMKELKQFGVRILDVTSNDKYHFQSGMKKEYLSRLKKINKSEKYFKKICIRGASDSPKRLFPKGEAKYIADTEKINLKWSGGYSCKGTLDIPDLSITSDGSVYNCCWNMYKLPGNIIEDSLDKVIYRAKKDPILKLLNSEGIQGLAKREGWSNKEIEKYTNKHGECGLCVKLNNLI